MAHSKSREQLEPIGFFELGTRRRTNERGRRKAAIKETPGEQFLPDIDDPPMSDRSSHDFPETLVWVTAAAICIGCGYWFIRFVL